MPEQEAIMGFLLFHLIVQSLLSELVCLDCLRKGDEYCEKGRMETCQDERMRAS